MTATASEAQHGGTIRPASWRIALPEPSHPKTRTETPRV